jgi:hypothetical protein
MRREKSMNGDADELSIIYESTIVSKTSLPALRVASVKRADFLSTNTGFDDFLSEAFRIPNSAVVSFEKWVNVAKKLETEGIWDELEHGRIFWPWRPTSDRQWSGWRKETRRIKSEVSRLTERPFFAKASVAALLTGPVYGPITVRRPQRVPIVHPLPRSDESVLSTLHSFAYLERDRIEVTPDELAYWVNAASCLTRPVPRRLEESLSAFLECDIPYSLSPRSQAGLLNRFVEEARLVAVFPIVSVAFPATHHLSEGNWVAAFEVLLAGAGASIVLASTFSLVEWILHLPRKTK